MNEWLDELSEFLRIESISAQPEHRQDVLRAGEWVRDFIRGAGGTAELADWNGHPLVLGEIAASVDPQRAPTVLCYGHFDVQPADPLDRWDSPPFEPELRDGYLYGRGVVDDKGQLYMLLAGARRLASESRLPVNVRFACDGEEEVGGSSIVEFIDGDERGADAGVIFDSGMMADGRPLFNVATRGWVYFHVELNTGASDLHSGEFGGAAMNAAHELMAMLCSLTAKDGRLADPLRAGALELTAAELAEWSQLTTGEHELELQGATASDPRAAEEFYLRTTAEPALDVNGFHSGSPYVQKTVLPVNAAANVSIRLAPGQQPAQIAAAFERLMAAATPSGAKLTLNLLSAVDPGVVDAGAEPIRLGQDAFERVLGQRPALIRVGGTLPIVAAFERRRIPVIITGLSLPDAKVHAPNENIPAGNITVGIDTACALFEALSALPAH